jgi:hypothetical protein
MFKPSSFIIILTMMIDDTIEDTHSQINSYKKLNKQLIRKIHARNKKIKYKLIIKLRFLFGCLQEY